MSTSDNQAKKDEAASAMLAALKKVRCHVEWLAAPKQIGLPGSAWAPDDLVAIDAAIAAARAAGIKGE
ncbi:MAG: hypothetical protein ACOY4R_27445 [Pseudomonadota bacterium]